VPIAHARRFGAAGRLRTGTAGYGMLGETALRGLSALLGVAATAVLARGLGPHDLGYYALWTLAVSTVSNIIEFSQRQPMLRALAATNDMDLIAPYVVGRLKVCACLTVCLGVAVAFVGPHRLIPAGLIIVSTLMCTSLSCVSVVLHANYRGDLVGAAIVVQSVQWLVLLGIATLIHAGIVGVACALWASSAINAVTVWILSQRVSPFRMRWAKRKKRRSQKSEDPRLLAVAGTAAMLAWKLDLPTCYGLLGPAPAGLYAASYRVLDQMLIVPTSLASVFTPRLTRASAEIGSRIRSDRIVSASLLVVSGVALVYWPLSPLVAHILFGHQYPGVSQLMRLLAGALPLVTLRYVLGSAFIVFRRTRAYLWCSLFYLVSSLAVTIILTLMFELKGTAVATSLAELAFVAAAVLDRTGRSTLAAYKLEVACCLGSTSLAVVGALMFGAK